VVVQDARPRSTPRRRRVAWRRHPSASPRSRCPCTTTIRGLASEVLLEPGDDPVPLRSAVNLDSIESVSATILVERLGRLSRVRMREICDVLAVAVDCSP